MTHSRKEVLKPWEACYGRFPSQRRQGLGAPGDGDPQPNIWPSLPLAGGMRVCVEGGGGFAAAGVPRPGKRRGACAVAFGGTR